MKYALIADIHGNLPALQAVLDDAQRNDVDALIFIGDYIFDLPWPNEVVSLLRSLPNATLIKGNREGYLDALVQQDQADWTSRQMGGLYWTYRALSQEYRDFLMNLPIQQVIPLPHSNHTILAMHNVNDLITGTSLQEIDTSWFRKNMEKEPFTHEAFLAQMHRRIQEDERLQEIVLEIPSHLIVFGHTHLQWHAFVGDTCILNPGSCGLPLDGNTQAAYTIVDFEHDGFSICEKRVGYDIESAIREAMDTTLYTQATFWSDLVIKQLRTAIDIVDPFFEHIDQLAISRGVFKKPYDNDLWSMAEASYRKIAKL